MNLIIKDAFRQILGRLASAVGGFVLIKLLTPYFGTLRMGDYGTIVNYFAMFGSLADFGLYVVAMRELGKLKKLHNDITHPEVQSYYHKFVSSRVFTVCCVYILALIIAWCIPAYTDNLYIARGLPLGMIFSASFMLAGILQIPLQLSRNMKQLSMSLVFARFVQIAIVVLTIYVWFDGAEFPSEQANIVPFLIIMGSVVASGLTQLIYVRLCGRKYMKLKRVWDRKFTLSQIKNNRQYGTAYFLSSMHTLIVFQLIGIFFPSVLDFDFAGKFYLGLTLMTILLIVPSAIGNSLMQDMGTVDIETKKRRYGSLLTLVVLIGLLVSANFFLFAEEIILFIGNSDYLSTVNELGADTVLSRMGIVLTLSFIKQVYNYMFVSQKIHNNLLGINLFGVIGGLIIGWPLILKHQLGGAIATQIILEILFVIGTLWIARKHDSLIPLAGNKSLVGALCLCLFLMGTFFVFKDTFILENTYAWILSAGMLNIIICSILYYPTKSVLRKL